MFIAGSYMLYSSPPSSTTTTTMSNGRRDPPESKRLTSGFSVSDILENRSRTTDEDDDDDDDDDNSDVSDRCSDVSVSRCRHPIPMTPKLATCVVVSRASPNVVRMSPKSGDLCSPSLPSSVSPPPPLSVCRSNLPQPPNLSSQLKFGVDRILAKDDVIANTEVDFVSSCSVCMSPFTPPTPPPPLPSSPQQLTRRTATACECLHPLCDGTGSFPGFYAYSSGLQSALTYPACILYPNAAAAHRLTSGGSTEMMLSGARVTVPNFVHPRSLQQPNAGVGLHHHQHPSQMTGGGQYMHGPFSTSGIGHHHHHHLHGSGPISGGGTSGSKRKRSWSRAVFSNLQRKGLEKRFQIQKYITKPDRRQLAATLGLTDAQVKVWFQNRRMKWRHSKEAKEEFAKQTNGNNDGTGNSTGNGGTGTASSKNDDQQSNRHFNGKDTQKSNLLSTHTFIKQDGGNSKMAAK